MAAIDEQILKTAKEVVIKFIECGRLSPTGFAETFQSVYRVVDETVKSSQKPLEKQADPKIQPPAHKPQTPAKKS